MNLSLRKLALLEQNILKQEENARIQGYTSNLVDQEFKDKITNLMDQVRYL